MYRRPDQVSNKHPKPPLRPLWEDLDVLAVAWPACRASCRTKSHAMPTPSGVAMVAIMAPSAGVTLTGREWYPSQPHVVADGSPVTIELEYERVDSGLLEKLLGSSFGLAGKGHYRIGGS